MHSFLHFVRDLKKKKEECELLLAMTKSYFEHQLISRNSQKEGKEKQHRLFTERVQKVVSKVFSLALY